MTKIYMCKNIKDWGQHIIYNLMILNAYTSQIIK